MHFFGHVSFKLLILKEEQAMFKTFKTNGITTTIEISEEGKVTYAVGKKKTTFDLSECDSFTYEFEAMDEKIEITEAMISETEGVEPWLWLVISKGEERLEYNNNKTETRRHCSYSDQNDKFDTLMTEEDVLDIVMVNFEKEALREAIKFLKPQQQDLVRDIYFKGLSMADIARRDSVHKSSITKRMNRVIEQLSKKLKKF